jgi:hypothetical protein
MTVFKLISFVEECRIEAGQSRTPPLVKAAVVAVIANPYAGKPYSEDLSQLIDPSPALGTLLAERGSALLGSPVESYGKGAVVGLAGEQEHGVASLTTLFGDALRAGVGGGVAWISSATKIGGPGTSIDIPLAYKDALYVRSHYDAMTITLHSAPLPDQIAVIAAFASRGRMNARVGGLSAAEATGRDGLR